MKASSLLLIALVTICVIASVEALQSPCSYCQYCSYCSECSNCPCDEKKNPNCKMCKYCPYCKLCNACSMCVEGGIVDKIAGLWGTFTDTVGLTNPDDIDETQVQNDLKGVKWGKKKPAKKTEL